MSAGTISGKPAVNLPVGVTTPEQTGAVGATAETKVALGSAAAEAVKDEDAYSARARRADLGPQIDKSQMSDLEGEIYENVFAPSGIPNPWNPNTTPAVRAKLESDQSYLQTVEASRAFLQNPTVENRQSLEARLQALPRFGNIMETLLCIIAQSVIESNADKRYYLQKLDGFNKIAKALSEQLEMLSDKSSELAQKEKGAKHPEKETVHIDNLRFYDTSTLDANGNPAVKETKSEDVTRQSLGTRMRVIESEQEEVRNNRQMAQTAFQAIDQRVNQLYQIMAQVSKTMNEERGAPIRNML